MLPSHDEDSRGSETKERPSGDLGSQAPTRLANLADLIPDPL
jgi:hypothetical protein